VEEEQDSEADGVNGAVGPCMEYMLQHRVLDTLYTFARTDVCHYLLLILYLRMVMYGRLLVIFSKNQLPRPSSKIHYLVPYPGS